ncbi:hypothetical protein Q4I30_006440 [Leishmania utingensis]|uniref:Uncharacterized protein n=1 Tax=Leishmania utingensis TaxID=653362 RepID=A0AAW3A5E6_9TRYP
MMSRGVYWHTAPVSLHISFEAARSTSPNRDVLKSTRSTAGRHHQQVASSPPLSAKAAEHIIFFGATGAFVHAAPLHITATEIERTDAETSKATEAPNAAVRFARPPTLSADTTTAIVSEMSVAEAARQDEEWVDAVDEEAMAFFGDE